MQGRAHLPDWSAIDTVLLDMDAIKDAHLSTGANSVGAAIGFPGVESVLELAAGLTPPATGP